MAFIVFNHYTNANTSMTNQGFMPGGVYAALEDAKAAADRLFKEDTRPDCYRDKAPVVPGDIDFLPDFVKPLYVTGTMQLLGWNNYHNVYLVLNAGDATPSKGNEQ